MKIDDSNLNEGSALHLVIAQILLSRSEYDLVKLKLILSFIYLLIRLKFIMKQPFH